MLEPTEEIYNKINYLQKEVFVAATTIGIYLIFS